jgi:hypothetical protein
MNRATWIRRLTAVGLILVALACGPGPRAARAQEIPVEPPPAQSAGGEPWYGYAAFVILGAFALFIVCKSARRG